jgi:hypothetical protein
VLGVPDSNTRNYLSKGTKLNSDYLESISSHFSHVNLSWLITGAGEPFLPGTEPTQNISTTKGKGNIVGQTIGTAIGNITLDDCRRELISSQKELEHLKQQLELKDALLAAKEEMLTLLRSRNNRPN